MKTTFTFNTLGICADPNVEFKASGGPVTLKVFTACKNGGWYAGYQLSIYTTCASATSQLVYPRNQKRAIVSHALALKAGVRMLDLALIEAIKADSTLAHFIEIKKFYRYKNSISA